MFTVHAVFGLACGLAVGCSSKATTPAATSEPTTSPVPARSAPQLSSGAESESAVPDVDAESASNGGVGNCAARCQAELKRMTDEISVRLAERFEACPVEQDNERAECLEAVNAELSSAQPSADGALKACLSACQ